VNSLIFGLSNPDPLNTGTDPNRIKIHNPALKEGDFFHLTPPILKWQQWQEDILTIFQIFYHRYFSLPSVVNHKHENKNIITLNNSFHN
jgi:hypothetical protein